MTLKELIESTLVKDEDEFMVRVPIFGNVNQIKCGKWFNDQILDLMDREIDSMAFHADEWNVELRFQEE